MILISFALLIAFMIAFMYYLNLSYFFIWIVFPIVAYIAVASAKILQDVSSGVSINPGQTFLSSLVSLPVIFGTLLLSTQFVIVRSPIVSLFIDSTTPANQLGDIAIEEQAHPYKKAIAIAYYMFFGALISILI